MEFALAESVTGPGPGFPLDVGGNKFCYSAPIVLVDLKNGGTRTINPTVIVSVNNKKVITAIPTTDGVTTSCRSAD